MTEIITIKYLIGLDKIYSEVWIRNFVENYIFVVNYNNSFS